MKMAKYFILATLLMLETGSSLAQQDNSGVEPINQAELEQILAPIALYPDTVLAHILVAATYPLEVIQAERWTLEFPDLQGSEAVEAVDDKNWDPSVKALVAFPHILKRLSEDLEWTERLGTAFLQDEEQLLAGVQSLRQRAYEEGSLDDLDKVSVTHEDDAIIIEPAEPEVVYLPYYDTRRVYGAWHSSYYPPVYWDCPYHNHHYAGYRHDPFYWGPRFHVSFGFFFRSFHWNNHNIVRIPRQHYNPRRHYNHQQIVSHHEARPWAHNQRGYVYRNARNSNRHQQQNFYSRPGQRDVATNRSAVHTQNARVSAPNRIRQELREGRVRTSERNYRATSNRAYPAFAPSQPRTVASARQTNSRPDSVPARSRTSPARPAARVSADRVTPQQRPTARINPQQRPTARASVPTTPNVVNVPRAVTPSVQRQAPQPAKARQPAARQEQKQASSRARPSNSVQGRVRTRPR